ncbi:hypothetical protein D3C75_270990 [compost metagenome]
MALEVTGNTANGIIRIGPDVDMAITVEIHCISAETARHELRQSHCASVGAFERQRIDLLFAGQQQELTQLLAEKLGTGRIVETQGRQGIDHPEISGITAEKGFNTDDRDNHLGRHAVFLLGTSQHRFVLTPEIHTPGYARIGDEHRAILAPLLDPFGRFGDGVQNRLLALGFTEHTHQLFTGETVVAGHFTDEFGHLG